MIKIREKTKSKIVSFFEDTWSSFALIFIFLTLYFIYNSFVFVGLTGLSIMWLMFVLLFRQPHYTLSYDVKVFFGDNVYVNRSAMDKYVHGLIKKWNPIFKKIGEEEREKIFSKIKIGVYGKEDRLELDDEIFNFINVHISDIPSTNFETKFHLKVSQILLPSISYSYRMSILRRFEIL